MDRALLLRLIRVASDTGGEVLGVASTSSSETRFSFTPIEPWSPGTYHLVVDAKIEDLAGNKPGRLFDVEVGQAPSSPGAVELSFEVP